MGKNDVTDPLNDERNSVINRLLVSRGTKDKLIQYVDLIRLWNERMNLVSRESLEHIWTRHILDSAQLIDHIPEPAQTITDLGSGAGFPGIVLAILQARKVHLVESVGKKANFLRHAATELSLNAEVHQARIEDIKNLKADVVTARALKALPELLGLAKALTHVQTVCLFLKGQRADEELTEAQKYWTFVFEKIPSISDPSGALLKITGLKELRSHGFRRTTRRQRK
jgi:16S rRNA (guanine527-N7)-methyltransferase